MIKKKIYTLILAAMLAMSFAGCASHNSATEASSTGESDTESKIVSSADQSSNAGSNTVSSTDQSNTASSSTDQSSTGSNAASSSTDQSNTGSNTVSSSNTKKSNTKSSDNAVGQLPNLEVHFGPNGPGYTLNLYTNNTAAEIARYVGQQDWNLPIYHFDDFENSNVMQYYDIPSRYKITSAPETITSEKAGDLCYSAPNRIILFYKDASVTGDFTKVGHLQSTNGLEAAVENNPVVPGWGNKVITITPSGK